MATFSERLKELRKAKSMTQENFAKHFFITKSAVSKYENGVNTPESKLLQKIADYFEVSTDYLLGRSDVRNSNIKEESNLSPQVETIAAHLEEKAENITPHKMKMLKRYIDDLFEDFDE